jgi:ArsR family transcriptional regulator, arsenate/arsenite/antimonite-responsive transcriptional repressor
VKETAELMKALSDETRLRILHLLHRQELCVCDLENALGLAQAKISRHLAVLRAAGLVVDERRAQWIHYRMSDGWWVPVLDRLMEARMAGSEQACADEARLNRWMNQKTNACTENRDNGT